MNSPETFRYSYAPSLKSERVGDMERFAGQIATLCVTLDENPSIQYRSDWENNFELANLVQEKLKSYKCDEPGLGEGPVKAKSKLLILDRGFDCISPLLHELTFQAMAYDLMPIFEDVYKYKIHGVEREEWLDETDDLWCNFRHEHIAVVSKKITDKLREFSNSAIEKSGIHNLTLVLKKTIAELPHHQKELSKYAAHLNMAEDCMNVYQVRTFLKTNKTFLIINFFQRDTLISYVTLSRILLWELMLKARRLQISI